MQTTVRILSLLTCITSFHHGITACGVSDAKWRARSESIQQNPVITEDQKAKMALAIDVKYMLSCYDAGREELFHYLWSKFGEQILEQERNSYPYSLPSGDGFTKRTLTDERILKLMLPALHRETTFKILLDAIENQRVGHVTLLLTQKPSVLPHLSMCNSDLVDALFTINDFNDFTAWKSEPFSEILKALRKAGFDLNKEFAAFYADGSVGIGYDKPVIFLCRWIAQSHKRIFNYTHSLEVQHRPRIFTEMIRILIQQGADVTMANAEGKTPLMILGTTAFQTLQDQQHWDYYNWDIAPFIKMLLAAGANPERDRALLAEHAHRFTEQFEKIFTEYAEEQATDDTRETGVVTRSRAKRLRTQV